MCTRSILESQLSPGLGVIRVIADEGTLPVTNPTSTRDRVTQQRRAARAVPALGLMLVHICYPPPPSSTDTAGGWGPFGRVSVDGKPYCY